MDKKKIQTKTMSILGGIIRFLFLAELSILILYPLFYSISVSLREARDLYDPLVILIPRHFTLDNIKNAFERMNYPVALVSSALRDFISVVLQVLSCSLVGYGLARFRFPGKKIVSILVMALIIIPPQTYIIPNYIQFRYFDPLFLSNIFGKNISVNLVNTNMAFWLPAAFAMGIRSALVIYIFRQFFRGMPKELEEAAYIDGCGIFKTYLKIMFPNVKPALVSTALLSLVWYWNDTVYTSSLTPKSATVMNQLHILKNNINNIMEYEMKSSIYESILLLEAGVFLSILPLLIIYIVFQRQFTESIERSGIVG